jgi:hypothetical protein
MYCCHVLTGTEERFALCLFYIVRHNSLEVKDKRI